MTAQPNVITYYSLFCPKCEQTFLVSVNVVAFLAQKDLCIELHKEECQGGKLDEEIS
jgi:hypothetical protein